MVGLRKNEKLHEDIISTIDFGTVLEYEDYYTRIFIQKNQYQDFILIRK
jgi:hypothetical protein